MNEEKLFVPDENNTIEYGKRITSLFYKLGFASKDEIKEELEQLILIGNIPYTLRCIGIPAGKIELVPSNIPHMIGRNQEKTEAKFKNMHNLTLEVVAIMQSNPKLSARYERNLSELGYHTLQLKTFSGSEIVSLAKSCTSIVCGKGDIPRFTQMMSRFPQIKKVEEIEAFLPQPIFKNQMPPLSEVINQQKTLGRKSR